MPPSRGEGDIVRRAETQKTQRPFHKRHSDNIEKETMTVITKIMLEVQAGVSAMFPWISFPLSPLQRNALWFFAMIILNGNMYWPMTTRLASMYPKILTLPAYRQTYVAKNVVKALTLMCLVPEATRQLYLVASYGQWNTASLQWLGVVYASTDTAALLYVDRLPQTTRMHHACTTLFCAYSLFCDYASPTIMRAVVLYATCSCYSYVVNAYLGMRHLLDEGSNVFLCTLAFRTYMMTLAVSWPLQLSCVYRYAFVHGHVLSCLIYLLAMAVVVRDDVVLLKYLAQEQIDGLSRMARIVD
jgi:hypothetical protein